jgi:hypothetical protein
LVSAAAARHGVPFAAILELEQMLGVAGRAAAPPLQIPTDGSFASEGRVQSLVRLEAAQKGVMLFRNNVGALPDKRGVPVRYGLANESKRQNEQIKSADLIGWQSFVIEWHHVGLKVAQFVSREVKEEGWIADPNDPHTAAQIAWLNLVIADGGNAAFCTGVGTL